MSDLQGLEFRHSRSAVNISVAYRDHATVTGGKVLVFLYLGFFSFKQLPFLCFLYLRKKDRIESGDRKFLFWAVLTVV